MRADVMIRFSGRSATVVPAAKGAAVPKSAQLEFLRVQRYSSARARAAECHGEHIRASHQGHEQGFLDLLRGRARRHQ